MLMLLLMLMMILILLLMQILVLIFQYNASSYADSKNDSNDDANSNDCTDTDDEPNDAADDDLNSKIVSPQAVSVKEGSTFIQTNNHRRPHHHLYIHNTAASAMVGPIRDLSFAGSPLHWTLLLH